MTHTGRARRTPGIRLLWLLTVPLIAALALAARSPAAAQDNASNFINSNYWPVDTDYRYVLAYPDSAWSWETLGLDVTKGCPPYRLRQREQSIDYWRTPGIDEEADWQQASRGNKLIPCYRGHAGTDIPAPSGTPVYAAADGTVVLTELNADTEGQGAMVVIDHHRTVAGVAYTWRVRYLHLLDRFPVKSGPVREGQLIGWMVNQGLNSHVHFEVQDFLGCEDRCIVNPWGPVYLWIDDDLDGFPDSAPSVLAAAPPFQELLPNPGLAAGSDGWLPAGDTQIALEAGALRLDLPSDKPAWPAVQTFAPFSLRAGAPVALSVTLSNPGSDYRFAFVTVSGVHIPSSRVGCLFTLPPQSGPLSFTLAGKAAERWANVAVTIRADAPGLVVHGARLSTQPGPGEARTRCGSPG